MDKNEGKLKEMKCEREGKKEVEKKRYKLY